VLAEKLRGHLLLKKFPEFHGTRRFIMDIKAPARPWSPNTMTIPIVGPVSFCLKICCFGKALRFNGWKVVWIKRNECQYITKECKCMNTQKSCSTECAKLCYLKNNSIFLTSNMPQRELCMIHKDIIILCIFWHGQSFALSARMNEFTGDVACTRVELGILSTQQNTYR